MFVLIRKLWLGNAFYRSVIVTLLLFYGCVAYAIVPYHPSVPQMFCLGLMLTVGGCCEGIYLTIKNKIGWEFLLGMAIVAIAAALIMLKLTHRLDTHPVIIGISWAVITIWRWLVLNETLNQYRNQSSTSSNCA